MTGGPRSPTIKNTRPVWRFVGWFPAAPAREAMTSSVCWSRREPRAVCFHKSRIRECERVQRSTWRKHMDDVTALKHEGWADSLPWIGLFLKSRVFSKGAHARWNLSGTRWNRSRGTCLWHVVGLVKDGCDGFTGASTAGTRLLLSSHPRFLTLPRLISSL